MQASEVRGYFMSEEEILIVKGRVASEYAKAERKLMALSQEAERLRKLYQEISTALHRPEWLIFDDDQIPAGLTTYEGFKPEAKSFQSSQFDGSRLKALCNDIRRTKLEVIDLAEKKNKLGL